MTLVMMWSVLGHGVGQGAVGSQGKHAKAASEVDCELRSKGKGWGPSSWLKVLEGPGLDNCPAAQPQAQSPQPCLPRGGAGG